MILSENRFLTLCKQTICDLIPVDISPHIPHCLSVIWYLIYFSQRLTIVQRCFMTCWINMYVFQLHEETLTFSPLATILIVFHRFISLSIKHCYSEWNVSSQNKHIWVIVTRWMLWVTVGRHKFKWVKFNPLSPHDALKHHFTSLKTDLIFLQQRVLETKIPVKLVYQYMTIFCNF